MLSPNFNMLMQKHGYMGTYDPQQQQYAPQQPVQPQGSVGGTAAKAIGSMGAAAASVGALRGTADALATDALKRRLAERRKRAVDIAGKKAWNKTKEGGGRPGFFGRLWNRQRARTGTNIAHRWRRRNATTTIGKELGRVAGKASGAVGKASTGMGSMVSNITSGWAKGRGKTK